ncbi:MAG: dehydrogenase E1 component subunit alpha/beta [Paludibaculum sp.]
MAARADSLPVIVPHDVTLELYRRMLTVALVEERLKVFAKQGKCTFQASTRGHEKLQVGMTKLLQPGHDWFFPYYRSKALAIGLGVPLKDIFLAMLSRGGDPSSNGRNMPEHFSDRALHLVAQTAVTGSQYLPAVGLARSLQLDGSDQIVHVSSGEGATSEGEFFEALNWASRESLPVIFTIQNNGFAISTRQQVQTGSTVRQIASGFGLRTFHIDGTWFEDMYRDLPPAIRQIREGAGPILIEADVVRLDPHSSSDDHRKYRDDQELAAMQERDPIQRTEQYLLRHGVLTREGMETQRESIREEVNRAALEADAAPQPAGDDLMAHIYSPVAAPVSAPPQPISAEPVAMIDAINHALREEMAANPRIVMFGEDIDDPKGGVFGVTRGLASAFPGRVENAPLAEASIVGVASGMAMRGFVPVVEIQFADYIWPAMLQMRNEVATVRWRSQGQWANPMVVRAASGGYIKGGPWHSACIEATFAHIPGWRVVFPSSADDAKGLLKTAMRCGDPVLFLEHKGLYRKMQAKAPEPDANYAIPFGQGRIRRDGRDLTIVTWGSTVYQALELARQMEGEGVSLEVLDLRTIAPFDEEMVYRSVRKTSRVVVAHEDSLTGGFGGEIVARIAENVLDSLDAPVVRVAAKDMFVPSASELELMALPSVQDLRNAVEKVLRY